jgi:putative transposase
MLVRSRTCSVYWSTYSGSSDGKKGRKREKKGLFFQRLTVTHATRWVRAKRRLGYGHVYQGRFKSFPIEADNHFYQALRYVERNALRAELVGRAVDWRWGSLWIREHGTSEQKAWLSTWPVPRPRHWREHVHAVQTEAELEALRRSVQRGAPYGTASWTASTVEQLGLHATLRAPGRPRKKSPPDR